MRNVCCHDCSAIPCSHEALMSLVAGYKDGPRCLSCLARVMRSQRDRVRDHLLGYIMSRSCRRTAWSWANLQEGADADALPSCLWPRSTLSDEEGEMEKHGSDLSDASDSIQVDGEWDAGSLGCGELVLGLRIRLQVLQPGQVLKLTATDAGMPEDLPAWCRLTGNKLISANHPNYFIRRKEN